MNFNDISISDMFSKLEHFYKTSPEQIFYAGGIVGTDISKMVIDTARVFYDFSDILMIEGCEDDVYNMIYNKKSPVRNYKSWIDFVSTMHVENEFVSTRLKTILPTNMIDNAMCSETIVHNNLFADYKTMIIFNAHLIPENVLNKILKSYNGKIVVVFDPLDMNGLRFSIYPTIYEATRQLSFMNVLARRIYDIDSRYMKKSSKKNFNMSNSVVKKRINANTQYVSHNDEIVEKIRNKQEETYMKRPGQRVIISDDIIRHYDEDVKLFVDNTADRMVTSITRGTLMTVVKRLENMNLEMRIHGSDRHIVDSFTYKNLANDTRIQVRPANIIKPSDVLLHRFNNLVFIDDGQPMPADIKYTILKNCNSLTIVNWGG